MPMAFMHRRLSPTWPLLPLSTALLIAGLFLLARGA